MSVVLPRRRVRPVISSISGGRKLTTTWAHRVSCNVAGLLLLPPRSFHYHSPCIAPGEVVFPAAEIALSSLTKENGWKKKKRRKWYAQKGSQKVQKSVSVDAPERQHKRGDDSTSCDIYLLVSWVFRFLIFDKNQKCPSLGVNLINFVRCDQSVVCFKSVLFEAKLMICTGCNKTGCISAGKWFEKWPSIGKQVLVNWLFNETANWNIFVSAS